MKESVRPPRPDGLRDAVAVIVPRDDRYLMIQRAAGTGFDGWWAPVTGEMLPDESQSAAAEREVQEEVGLSVRALRKIWGCPTEEGGYYLHWWLVGEVEGEVRPDPAEVADHRWILPEEIRTLRTFRSDLTFFLEVLPALSGDAGQGG